MNDELISRLIDEKTHGIKGGIYHKLQIDFAYNSNHIEGSRLTDDQTQYIFAEAVVGDFKKHPNYAGDLKTTALEKVAGEINALTDQYLGSGKKDLYEILDFTRILKKFIRFMTATAG